MQKKVSRTILIGCICVPLILASCTKDKGGKQNPPLEVIASQGPVVVMTTLQTPSGERLLRRLEDVARTMTTATLRNTLEAYMHTPAESLKGDDLTVFVTYARTYLQRKDSDKVFAERVKGYGAKLFKPEK